MQARPRNVEVYESASGSTPFDTWMRDLKDPVGRAAVDAKVALLRRGSLGNYRDVGDGLIELKVNVGPGYRGIHRRRRKELGHFARRKKEHAEAGHQGG